MSAVRQEAQEQALPTRPRVFFSYSRSEAPLVHDLGAELEKAGIDTWIDYQDLAPGSAWDEQLDRAVEEADVVLLVVSRRAVASHHVADEWKNALDAGKRMILVIAEAAPLPAELEGLEWVDVRTRYRSAVRDLIEAISRPPAAQEAAPPQRGFRAPLRVWLAFAGSVVTAVASVGALWTVVIPALLVPLPARILRRSFDYTAVRNALLALPMALIVSELAIFRRDDTEALLGLQGTVTLTAIATFFLIRSGSFRRWAMPAAARPHWLLPGLDELDSEHIPEPTRYRMDVAPEDAEYAGEVERALSRFGHERVEDGPADLVLRFVSSYNDIEEIDPAVLTLPIILSDPDDELPVRLRRTQWIDLRRGPDPQRLEAMAVLLDRPGELLEVIGSPPPHDQHVLPKGVQGLFVALWVSICSVLGFFVLVGVGLRSDLDALARGETVWTLALGAVAIGGMLGLIRSLRSRRPRRLRASVVPLLALGAAAVSLPLSDIDGELAQAESIVGLENAYVSVIAPVALLAYFWVFHSSAIRRWVPARGKVEGTSDRSDLKERGD